MDRKQFIQVSAFGMGLSLLPNTVIGKEPLTGIRSDENANPKILKDEEGEVLNVIGDIQTHKLIGDDTNGQIVEWVDNVDPGVGIPPHIHTNEDEIFRVVRGQVEIRVDAKTTVLKAGDIAYAPKNIPHSWKVVGTEKAKMITSAFPAGIEKMFGELADLPPGPPDFERVASICANHGVSFV